MDQRASIHNAATVVFLGVLIAMTTSITGCRNGRLPVCESNADCAEADAGAKGKICYNLRCVECHYDTDCPVGHACSSANTCQPLSGPKPNPDEDKQGAGWEPNNWDECAQRCKDATCIQDCDRRFQKP